MSRCVWVVSCVALVGACDPFPLKGSHPNDIPPRRPSVTAVDPAGGTPSGGTEVEVAGQDFDAGAQLLLDGIPATDVSVVSPTRITARTPAHAPGAVAVTVVNPDDEEGSLPAGFTYRPNTAPQVETDLPADATALMGETVAFRVTATDPDGDLPTLRLVNPPPGCAVLPADPAEEDTAELTVRWLVAAGSGGAQHLVFDALDGQGHTTRVAVTLRITGVSEHSAISCCDVTGDGIPDVVAGARLADGPGGTDTGALFVWAGTATTSGSPTATLRVPLAAAGDMLGSASGQGIQCSDVTGDGILDVVAGAKDATGGAGAIYVWAGGPGLSGTVAPTATLTAGAVAGDQLGVASGQGIQCCDVTGDGIADVVAGAQDAGATDTGAVYVWRGGPLSGVVAPTATLTVPGAADGDRLGFASGQGVQCCDVTGDGILDVVAGAQDADIMGVADTGAVFVWAGASALSGAVAPTATLTVPGAAAGDRLGAASGQGIQCCDVTGDGIPDVVAGAQDAGATDAGAIYVWRGGAGLLGAAVPTATLTVPGAAAGDKLGSASGQGIQCCDVTGDGIPDVVAGAQSADIGGIMNTGAIYVWAGGPGLSGAVAQPRATLTVPGAVTADQLGLASGHGIQCCDVTGDAILDVVAGAQFADVGIVIDTGAIYLWAGGPGLSGTVVPTATLTVPDAVAADQLGLASGQGIQCCDVTGDGVPDVVAGAQLADIETVSNTGAIYVWEGGSALSGSVVPPTTTMRVPGAAPDDNLGQASGQGIQCCDVTGDGILDVVAGAQVADVGTVAIVDAGTAYVWAGGSSSDAPTATLTVPGAVTLDRLCEASGDGIRCCDVTGDGIADIVAGAQGANTGAVADRGVICVWAGGPGLSGAGPTATVRGAVASDQLGLASGQAIQCCDVTGDGVPDVVAGVQFADVVGVMDTGAVYLVPGGSTLVTLPPRVLAVPGAVAGDQLGS